MDLTKHNFSHIAQSAQKRIVLVWFACCCCCKHGDI